ncbi:hypothetical protein [Pendulispora albinea]|uniref:Uncharacterized protein n=1 Tax=Pendulispora albinea TaxID=2741071 RepID=A0ABZ2M3K3_9BACT
MIRRKALFAVRGALLALGFAGTFAAFASSTACSKSPAEPLTPPEPLPPGHGVLQDKTPKEGPRLVPVEAYIRTYLTLFGNLSPLQAQTNARGTDGANLFDTWRDYLGTMGMPDYRYDTPRVNQTNTLMVATFERIGVALCDRAMEHDKALTPRFIYDFDMPKDLDAAAFAPRFDVVHRTFLNYPAQLAPTDRTNRFWKLYQDTVKTHATVTGSRFSPAEAGWAAVCYGLIRHPEFHLY